MNAKNAVKINERKKELIQRTSEIFGISENESVRYFNPKKSILRINSLKVLDVEELLRKIESMSSIKKINWIENVYLIENGKENLTQSTEFKQGLFYIQNASSILPILALNPMPGELVLDACAAPGGKSILIAELTKNKAVITCNDADHLRVGYMKKLCELYGSEVESFYSQPAQFLTKHLGKEYFDKILVDAPCSGEGMLNIGNEDTLKYWSIKKIKRLSKLQKRIIKEMYNLLKPGGTLVYSTCTFAPEENEENIDYALQNFEDLQLVDAFPDKLLENVGMKDGLNSWKNKKYKNDLKKCKRVVPNEYMEAFFIANLEKKSG